MTRATRIRRLSALTGAALVATLLPLTGPASPASASPDCTSEETPPPTLPPDFGCDDETPPDTELTDMAPAPNAAGWTTSKNVGFAFRQVVGDADAGPWTFMCKLEGPSAQAHDWQPCTSPQRYAGLEDTTATTEHTFSVYAVDAGDGAIGYLGNPFLPEDDEDPAAPDDDSASPATVSWRQDTVKPSAFIIDGPSDPQGGWPILEQPRTSFLVDASEPDVDYRCQLDGRTVGCNQGKVALTGLSGGDRTFTVRVTDPAGNVSTQATEAQFTVPYDLRSAKGWKRVRAKGAFAGSLLQTRTMGARIRFSAPTMRELRFRAPAGGALGKVRVRVGQGVWKTFDLGRGPASSARWYVVRDESSPLSKGPVQIESLSSGPVRIDALVFPPTS